MVKRQRGSAAYPQFKGIGGARRPVDVCSARTGVERRLPQQAKMHLVYTGALLANLQKMKGRTLFMRNLVKEQRLGRNGIENLCVKPTFNYCTGEEQFTFFKLPKCLIDDACFWGLSIDAKLLYAIFFR